MTTQAFLNAVCAIADAAPSYREGGTGADGTCDCIGLVMGAMYALGRAKYDLHSSNYFARFQTDDLQPVTDAAQLACGMVVYKARGGEETLNARYLPGGSCHTGDLMDYYHAGVVERVQPLCIVHCTSTGGASGIVRDDRLGGWTHCGTVKGLSAQEAKPATAVVYAQKGQTVNLRKRPQKDAPLVCRVPIGTVVSVSETADGWARVQANGENGYMMQTFLAQDEENGAYVKLPLDKAQTLLAWLNAAVMNASKEDDK